MITRYTGRRWLSTTNRIQTLAKMPGLGEHLLHVVFDAPQRHDVALVHHLIAAQHLCGLVRFSARAMCMSGGWSQAVTGKKKQDVAAGPHLAQADLAQCDVRHHDYTMTPMIPHDKGKGCTWPR